MELFFIRHAESHNSRDRLYSEKNYPDPDLTSRGREQAALLGVRFASAPPDAIYSSDLLRARETASAVSQSTGKSVIFREELREIDMGELHLSSWDSVEKRNPGYYKRWSSHTEDLPYPGGESGSDVNRRMLTLVREILAEPYQRVVLVSHRYAIASCICGLMEIPQQKLFFLGNPLENTSISTVYIDTENGAAYLHSLNDSFHLLPEWPRGRPSSSEASP